MIIYKFLFITIYIRYTASFDTEPNHYYSAKTPSPLIIVPGDAGSRAYAEVKQFSSPVLKHLWVNLFYLIFPKLLMDYFKLNYDIKTHTTSDMPSVKIFFPGWGSTLTIEQLDERNYSATQYFAPFVKELLKDKFYRRNYTLRGAPYDFRKAPNENTAFINALKILVEETYNNAGKERVVLLAHSLGSTYSLYFLKQMSQSWKQKYLRSFVSVSGPLGGAVQALLCEVTGESLLLPWSYNIYRELERSFPSMAFLLPKSNVFGNMPIVITPKRNYSANDYEALFNDMNFTIGNMMINDTKDLVDGSQTPEGIDELHCIHGWGKPTKEQLIFSDFPNKYPIIKYGAGDDTVKLESLEICKKWKGVHYFPIKGAGHTHIAANRQFISRVKEILYNKPKL